MSGEMIDSEFIFVLIPRYYKYVMIAVTLLFIACMEYI